MQTVINVFVFLFFTVVSGIENRGISLVPVLTTKFHSVCFQSLRYKNQLAERESITSRL